MVDWPAHTRRALERLAEEFTYTRVAGGSFAVKGVFVGPHEPVVFEDATINSNEPRALFMNADLTGTLAIGDSLLRLKDSKTYKVRNLQEPDLVAGTRWLDLAKGV